MIRRATVNTWAEHFEKREGVRISDITIRRRLKEAGKIGETARNKIGRLIRGAYFSEQDVREACANLLSPLPQANEKSFFMLDGVRHGTIEFWSMELGLDRPAFHLRLRERPIMPLQGRSKAGNLCKFYSEPQVRDLMSDRIGEFPQANMNNFFVLEGCRHGTIYFWSKELGISEPICSRSLKKSQIPSIRGRCSGGQIRKFYAEPEIRELLSSHLKKNELPQADGSGFFIVENIRYGNAFSWSREIGISNITIAKYLKDEVGLKGRDDMGQVRDFYPEPAVRSACKDLIEKRKGQEPNRESAIGNRKSEK